jgi:hypothetical protein
MQSSLTTPSPSDPSPEASDLSSAGPYQREQERRPKRTGRHTCPPALEDSDSRQDSQCKEDAEQQDEDRVLQEAEEAFHQQIECVRVSLTLRDSEVAEDEEEIEGRRVGQGEELACGSR